MSEQSSNTGSQVVLASGSAIRAEMLRRAAVTFEVVKPRVDEESVKAALLAEAVSPRDISDALAELKAEKVALKRPDAFVIGSDQVLDFDGEVFGKPEDRESARAQLRALSGKAHKLHSAAVIFHEGKAVWRKVSTVKMQMHPLSDSYIDAYLDRNWPEVGWSCGAYQLEHEGSRLFLRVDGDYFSVLGMPLLDVLGYLSLRKVIDR